MTIPLTLSIEQELLLRNYEIQVPRLSEEQARQFLLETLHQLMIKDNVIRHLMKHGI